MKNLKKFSTNDLKTLLGYAGYNMNHPNEDDSDRDCCLRHVRKFYTPDEALKTIRNLYQDPEYLKRNNRKVQRSTMKTNPKVVRLLGSTHEKLKNLFPVLNLPSSIDQAVQELYQIRNDENIVTLNLDESILSDLKELAISKNQTLESYIIEHVG